MEWNYQNYDVIDCHVHSCHLTDRASIVFPEVSIPEIQCEPRHIVRLQELCGKTYKYVCSTCEKIIYLGTDPYRPYNEELLKNRRKNELIFPIVAISSHMKDDICYYVEKYGVKGIKLHPNYSSYEIDSCVVPRGLIYIIHCGTGVCDNPSRIINFAKKCKSPVAVAHLGRLNKNLYDSLKQLKNVVMDCSPLMCIWETYRKGLNSLYDASFLGEINSPYDLLMRVMEYVGSDKIVYGSDIPIDNSCEDLSIIEKLPSNLRQKIQRDNFINIMLRLSESSEVY